MFFDRLVKVRYCERASSILHMRENKNIRSNKR